MTLLALAAVTIVAYLIGALPAGAIVAHINKVDISRHGSGKTGTTNVLRTVGRRAALLVLAGDLLKGAGAVLVARALAQVLLASASPFVVAEFQIAPATLATMLGGAGAVVGHVWSIFMRLVLGKWNGGRGVATALGAALVVSPLVMLAAVAFAVPTILISRYVSLGSIVGSAAGAIALIVLVAIGQMEALYLPFVFLAVFIIAAHRDNIERLLSGTERKLGERAKL